MRCTMGSSPAKLTVLPSRTVFLAGQPMANISDHKSMVNLAPFGVCRSLGFPPTASATAAAHGHLTPMPCMHNTPAPWYVGKMDYFIKGQPALLQSCKCQCLWGGTISLINNGQVGEGAQGVNETPKGRSMDTLSSNQSIKEGGWTENWTEKSEIAAQYREKGMGVFTSYIKANRDVNFKNSKNKEGWMSDQDADDKKSNKNFGKNGQFSINCATTTITFMLRKKGYDVTALAYNANKHTKSIADGLNLYDVWRNADGSKVSPTMLLDAFNSKVKQQNLQTDLSRLNSMKAELIEINTKLKKFFLSNAEKQQLKARQATIQSLYFETRKKFAPIYKEILMDSCQEEGYYTFGLVWESVNIGGGHYTVIKSEKDENGNIVLTNIEPQTGEPFQNIDTLIQSLDYPPAWNDTIMRTDNKVFNEEYNDLFEIN